MHREYHAWHSPALGRHMELLVFGHAGTPVLVFPSSMGKYYEYENMGMVGTLADKIDAGYIQLYCVDSVDTESWYNRSVGADWRVARHIQYENYLLYEVLPLMYHKSGTGFIITAGCSFGGFHAANIAFRHPERFGKIISQSGRFNSRGYTNHADGLEYYLNSPLEFMANIGGGALDNVRRMEIILASSNWDIPFCLNETRSMSQVLWDKGIWNKLEIWNEGLHDWPLWRDQIRHFL